jgi:hypothetical protein
MMKTGRTLYLGPALAAFALGMLVGSSPALAGDDTTKLEAELFPPVTGATAADQLASGKATWEQRTDRTRVSVQVEDVQLTDRTAITINMCGATATKELVGGFADFNADSRDGDMVPNCAGNPVTVYYEGTDTDGIVTVITILEGVLEPK